MSITFCGAARIISGTCYLIETKKVKFLVDCGIFQGENLTEKNYQPFLFNPKEIDFVFLTHAHLDHTGLIPRLIKEGFRGKIICTPPTRDFYPIMLFDSQTILEKEALGLCSAPLYSKDDVRTSLKYFKTVDYGRKIKLNNELTFRFRDAGHILGSAIIEIWVQEAQSQKKIVFSGDLGNPPVPLLRPTEFIDEANYVLIESTYGKSLHEDFEKRRDILEDIIEETFARGGVLLMPVFSLERTQELLSELNELVKHRRIPKVPIFVDNPMAIASLKIYRKYQRYFNKETFYNIKSGEDIFNFSNLFFTKTKAQSKKINEVPPPKIVIAGSGMSQGGRILHHEIRYLPDPKSTILMICYQAKGTLGRKILDGAKEIEIFNKKALVNAQVKSIRGYSAHADQEMLLGWIKKIKKPIRRIFVVQGEEESTRSLVQTIRDHLAIDAIAPKLGETFEL